MLNNTNFSGFEIDPNQSHTFAQLIDWRMGKDLTQTPEVQVVVAESVMEGPSLPTYGELLAQRRAISLGSTAISAEVIVLQTPQLSVAQSELAHAS